jgi:beta-1,4-N-acetylglucosaminyltransferase
LDSLYLHEFVEGLEFIPQLRTTNRSTFFILTMTDTWKWMPESKLCFVTTGATAPFTALIESVLSPTCLDVLREGGFTHLLVQYGSAKDIYNDRSSSARTHLAQSQQKGGLVIDGIDFNPDGLQAQFKLVQRSKGLVISHAGTYLTCTW